MNLQDLEARLQTLIEVKLVKAIPGQKAEDLIIQKMMTAMKSGAIIRADGRHIAPNVYTLMVSADSLPQWKEPHLLETLVEVLKATAQEAGLQFDAPPALTIAEDPRLLAGDFNLIASNKIEPMEETRDMRSDTENTGDNEDDPESIPENAFLIVEGVKVFPLNQVVVNIGRRLDNTLVIDDPRVSRNHAQLRSIKGRYVVFDLNSTGGTFVNGQRSSQSVLYPGDVISLAGVTLIFGQDNPPSQFDISNTTPRNDARGDRPTAVIRTMPPSKKKGK